MNTEKVVNLTGKDVSVVSVAGTVIKSFPFSKDNKEVIAALQKARQKTVQEAPVNGCPVTSTDFELDESFPSVEENTIYIVDPRVKQLFPERKDFIATGTPAIRFGIEGEGKFINFVR